ncbi:MAG TPA: hypothetical protein VIK45_22010, partial [Candidatus Dormibacteraeota bacterium]
LAAGRQIPAHAGAVGTLGINGRPAGADLPTRPAQGRKVVPPAPGSRPAGPNSARGARSAASARTIAGLRSAATRRATPRTPPTTVNANFSGISQATSNCGGCQPPDPNAAVGLTQIAEAVNLRLEVYSQTGAAQCGVGLNTFLGTASALSDPRIQYDNLYNRFSMVVTVVPPAGATPAVYVLASKTASACGSWWVYRMTFFGSFYPAGTLLDYPYLGQDRASLLFSSNNFCCAAAFHYLNSAAFSISKALVYSGAGVGFSSYPVAFSTAPVTVSGIPIAPTSNTYFLASVPGFGYDLYRMTTGPNNPIVLQAAIFSPFTAPTRRVNQPGTTQTLDPLDGRIPWAPVQSQNYVWFAHGMDLSGYPAIRYGAIGALSNSAFVATAFHSGTSDDFNPSIGVADAGSGTIYAWLNWAYTDTPRFVATSDTINGVLPGAGVPNLIGTDRTLVTGFHTWSNFRFGDFSSVEVDPTAATGSCPAGRTAVTNQEYFTASGQWATRLARLSFC